MAGFVDKQRTMRWNKAERERVSRQKLRFIFEGLNGGFQIKGPINGLYL